MTDNQTLSATPLTDAYSLRTALVANLAAMRENFKRDETALKGRIAGCDEIIAQAGAGLDPVKIALARTVIAIRGSYARGGAERGGAVADAIQWLATGTSPAYKGLDKISYGTKNYDAWSGQRSDHEYGMGPRHGSICFAIELLPDARRTHWSEINEALREAAIYLLANIAAVEAAKPVAA